jgi:hypothetical protein
MSLPPITPQTKIFTSHGPDDDDDDDGDDGDGDIVI